MAWKYCGAVGQSWPGGYSLTLDPPQSGQQLSLLPALPHTPLLLRLPPRAEVEVVIQPAVRPASPNPYRGRPAASRSAPTPAEEDSPGDHPNPAPTEPVPEQPPAPPGADAGPSQSSSFARHRYRTTIPSEAAIARQPDAPTSLLMMKGCLGSLWAESMDQMGGAPPLVQMDSKELRERVSELELQLNDPAQASYALRAEIQALTNQTDRQKRSLIQVKDELQAMREERTASEAGYQQQLAHQAQEIRSKDTLLQERGERLEVQAAQLETQAAELRALKAELSQSRAALSGAGARFSATIPYTAAGVIRFQPGRYLLANFADEI
ncbi:MAP7 domain-containing protein 1-like [Zingiber officinale]|uniref:MAP7 domain-containing protein 1-like n=1 Tax=Zingiber officinale TaxID=94328 RepID=UPI001C4B8C31|nr:MAP7 domain-containing protein 1-like [Zingiber officinale]